jgi:hypothetical protein
MQRVVATRMFEPSANGATEYKWKIGEKKSWTTWFNANGKYRAESALMELELMDSGAVVQWYHVMGLFTTLGAIVIGSLVLVIIGATIALSCVFCKCCVKCRSCGCMKGCAEKCKRAPKEDTPEGEGADGEGGPEGEVELEEFDYAPKPARGGRIRRAGTTNAASPPGSPAR